jgi:hypothetical protein
MGGTVRAEYAYDYAGQDAINGYDLSGECCGPMLDWAGSGGKPPCIALDNCYSGTCSWNCAIAIGIATLPATLPVAVEVGWAGVTAISVRAVVAVTSRLGGTAAGGTIATKTITDAWKAQSPAASLMQKGIGTAVASAVSARAAIAREGAILYGAIKATIRARHRAG